MKIKLKISELVASCLQSLIVDEVNNQKRWYEEDLEIGVKNDIRKTIICEMNELADDLEKQGIAKHIKCY